MKKTTAQRLATVLKVARLREQQSAVKLAENIRNVEANTQQQQQLQQYQTDYSQQFKQQAGIGQSAKNLANFQQFFAGLEQANNTQQQRTVLAQSQLDQAKTEWQRRHAKGVNLEALIAKKQHQHDREQENLIQRELDDRVSKIADQ